MRLVYECVRLRGGAFNGWDFMTKQRTQVTAAVACMSPLPHCICHAQRNLRAVASYQRVALLCCAAGLAQSWTNTVENPAPLASTPPERLNAALKAARV